MAVYPGPSNPLRVRAACNDANICCGVFFCFNMDTKVLRSFSVSCGMAYRVRRSVEEGSGRSRLLEQFCAAVAAIRITRMRMLPLSDSENA